MRPLATFETEEQSPKPANRLHNSVGSLDLSTLWLLDDQRLRRKEPNMRIGVDYHPSFQQIAFLVEETGEYSGE
jgi:hypothetical protein